MKLNAKERAAFSWANLLSTMASGGLHRGNTFESEILESAAAEAGRPYDPQRVLVPLQLLKRDMTAAGVSGSAYLVADENAPEADILRPWSVSMRAGITFMPGLVGNVPIPKTTATSTGYWLSDEGTAITPSQPTIGQVSLTPKMAGALVQFTHQLRSQSNVEAILRRELLRTTGSLIDAAVFNGSGTSGEPHGLLGTSGIGTQSGTSLAWAGILNLEQQCADANAEPSAYIGTPAVRELLKAREKAAGSGMVWDGDVMNGRPAYATTSLPAGTLVTGDWAQLVLGMWGGLEIQIAPPDAAGFKNGTLAIRLLAAVDVGVLHPGAFSYASSIT